MRSFWEKHGQVTTTVGIVNVVLVGVTNGTGRRIAKLCLCSLRSILIGVIMEYLGPCNVSLLVCFVAS